MTSARERDGHVVWVDLSTPDVARAIHFYERLFGWHYMERDTEMGLYVTARVETGQVGGVMPQPPEQAAAGIPPAWTVLVGAGRLETVMATARELGGSVLQTPLSIPGGARVAVIADPAGAALGMMDAPAPESAMVWGYVGAVCWVECLSRDPVVARRFYEQLLGWTSEEGTGGYVVFSRGGERVGGLVAMPSSVPEQAPSHWLVYVAVADVAVSCERAIASGGTVLAPAHDIEEGRFAVLADPAGATLAVFEELVPRS